MNFRIIILITVLLSLSPRGWAQRIVGELEANTDKAMIAEADSADSKKKAKFVPTSVRAWTIDETYGNMTPTFVDTLHHAYQNNSLSEGMIGEYNTLSNLGSPRINRLYMERSDASQFIFTDAYDQFFTAPDKFRFWNTKSPFMNIAYNFCGSKQTGYDNLHVLFTNNAGKRINFGGKYDYLYGQGYYDNQQTGYMNGSAWASYIGDRYDMHIQYQHNFMKGAENGGITDETYITHPEEIATKFGSKDIPVALTDTWNRQEHDMLLFNHHYNIGFTRAEGDSADLHDIFVPVTRVYHTLKLSNMMHNYRTYREARDYHSYTYINQDNDSTEDRTKYFSIKNTVGLSLCEGFNKWAAAGINLFAAFEYRSFTLLDTLALVDSHYEYGRTAYSKHGQSDFSVGGQLIRTQGKRLHYNVNAEFVLAGENIGAFDVSGQGDLNFKLLKDTVQLAVNAFIKNQAPSFYHKHYHSKHAWWDQDVSKILRQRIEGTLTIPHTKTRLKVGFENIKNYVYYLNNGYVNTETNAVTNNISVQQYSGNVQVFSARLQQDFKLGPLHLDNDVTYQTSSNQDILPLPTISTYHNLYLDFRIAKVLHTEFGVDCKFFTSYYAPDYSPVLSQFCVQNENRKTKVGNHPLLSVYANFDLKRLRFYVQYYHFNRGTSRSFWAPGYPMNPTSIHFGLSWNFYN